VGYAGTLSVTIDGQGGIRSGVLHVVHGDGAHVVIEAPDPPGPVSGSRLVQTGQRRSVVRVPDGSVNRGQAAKAGVVTGDFEPDGRLQQLLAKYRVLLEGGSRVLGRDAETVRVERRSDARVVERWTIDTHSGLLLKRESYNLDGKVERSLAFTEVREPYAPTSGELHPANESNEAPERSQRWFASAELAAQVKVLGVPATLPAGYRVQSGTAFRASDVSVVQLEYSDGLEDVSLFVQPGVLTRGSLAPGAHELRLKGVTGWQWDGFPRGVAWQDGPSTLTLVGSPPADELARMAGALPQAPLRRSLRQRLGHLIGWVKHQLP